jgi:hypothetical protein
MGSGEGEAADWNRGRVVELCRRVGKEAEVVDAARSMARKRHAQKMQRLWAEEAWEMVLVENWESWPAEESTDPRDT